MIYNFDRIYDSIKGKYLLSHEEENKFNSITLPTFEKTRELFLFFDDIDINTVKCLNVCQMEKEYKNGNYRAPDGIVRNFEDFLVWSCTYVLYMFSDWDKNKIKEELEKRI